MKLVLAPMEGLVDVHLRTLLTASSDFDHCVTEFLRVVDRQLPERVFHRLCPEAKSGWKTPSGTPVHLQILGSHPQAMADNACVAANLGAPAIDVNLGCPSKFVCNSHGGSILLKDPNVVYNILNAVRTQLPPNIPLTAKMRLGYEDKTLTIENAQAIESAGVSELCVHARTKVEGYTPRAHWEWITRIKDAINIPVVANGEIWNVDDFTRCSDITGCEKIMLGRGVVADPTLARSILTGGMVSTTEERWPIIFAMLKELLEKTQYEGKPQYGPSRVKQWLSFMRISHLQAAQLFKEIKRLKTSQEISLALNKFNSNI